MSGHEGEAVPNGTVNGKAGIATDSNVPFDLPQSKFVSHLATYPAVTAVAGLVASNPVVKIFASNAVPLLQYINDRLHPEEYVQRAAPVLERADLLGESVLTEVDKRFPHLKTTQPAEIYELVLRPVETARQSVTSYEKATREAVVSGVHAATQPVYSAAETVRSQYEAQGKTYVDPLVSPLNDRLEHLVLDLLPSGEPLPERDAADTELARTYTIARAAVNRARPVLYQRLHAVRELPAQARTHVSEVYVKNVSARQNGTKDHQPTPTDILLAYFGTGRDLYEEGRAAVGTIISVPLDYIRRKERDANNAAAAASDEAVSRATDFVEKFVGSTSSPTTNVSEVTTTGNVSVTAA